MSADRPTRLAYGILSRKSMYTTRRCVLTLSGHKQRLLGALDLAASVTNGTTGRGNRGQCRGRKEKPLLLEEGSSFPQTFSLDVYLLRHRHHYYPRGMGSGVLVHHHNVILLSARAHMWYGMAKDEDE